MARYNLIIKDETYYKLMQMALEKQISMGRLLNDILNVIVSGKKLDIESKCYKCGKSPAWQVWKDNTQLLACEEHYKENFPEWESWRQI